MSRLVHYDRTGPLTVDTADELDHLLDGIADDPQYRQDPVLVDIGTTDKQRILQVGLGRTDCSILVWYDWQVPEVKASAGTLQPDEPLAFNYGGTWTDIRDDAGIPVEIARRAAREFFDTGERPASVLWQDKAP